MILRFWKNLLLWSFRLNAGGGGDGGAGAMRADELDRQRKVQAAVDAINAKFGVAPQGSSPSLDVGPAPDRAKFTSPAERWVDSPDGNGYFVPDTPTFNEAAYNEALAAYNGKKAGVQEQFGDVAGAKTARESMYSDISSAVRDTALRDLDRQYTDASKRNTFGLARSGLLGGSVDAESGAQLQELYGEGRLKAAQAGLGAASDLRSQDEKTRQNLISLAQSGLDTGTAASMAAGSMASAADVARSQAGGATVGRLFDDLSQAYVTNQVMKTRYPAAGQQQQPSGYGTPSLWGTNRYTGSVGR